MKTAKLKIFRGCKNLIRTLPLLQYDDKRPSDAAKEPHEITHAPDALWYFCVYYINAAKKPKAPKVHWTEGMKQDYRNAKSRDEREFLINKWGVPL